MSDASSWSESSSSSEDESDSALESLLSQTISASLRWGSSCNDTAPHSALRVPQDLRPPVIRAPRVPISLQTVFLASCRGDIPESAPRDAIFPGIGKQQRSIKMESLCKPGNIKPASIFLYTIRTYYITPVIGNRRHIFQSMLPAVPRKQSQVRKGNYRKNSDGWQVPKKLCREFRLGQTPKKSQGLTG